MIIDAITIVNTIFLKVLIQKILKIEQKKKDKNIMELVLKMVNGEYNIYLHIMVIFNKRLKQQNFTIELCCTSTETANVLTLKIVSH